MRRLAATLLGLAAPTSCGYIGPVLPPSPMIPTAITDLNAVQRGDEIIITFRTPPRTTDGLTIREFADIDMRVGLSPAPFDFDVWAKTAKLYPLSLPPASEFVDPRVITMIEKIPASDWTGQHVAVAVRTSVKSGDRYSAWSNRVVLDVAAPLAAPSELTLKGSGEGAVLDWKAVAGAKSYRILRASAADKQPLEVGNPETAHYLDTTAQYDVAYTYSVSAVANSSESVAAQAPPFTMVDTFAPSVPSGLTVLAGPTSIELSWQRSPETDTKGYYVFRSVDNAAPVKMAEMVTLPAFSDRNVERGKTYRYQVSAVDNKNNESVPSSTVQSAF